MGVEIALHWASSLRFFCSHRKREKPRHYSFTLRLGAVQNLNHAVRVPSEPRDCSSMFSHCHRMLRDRECSDGDSSDRRREAGSAVEGGFVRLRTSSRCCRDAATDDAAN